MAARSEQCGDDGVFCIKTGGHGAAGLQIMLAKHLAGDGGAQHFTACQRNQQIDRGRMRACQHLSRKFLEIKNRQVGVDQRHGRRKQHPGQPTRLPLPQ